MTLLIGVHYIEEHTGAVIKRLSYEQLENKKIMTETFSHPLDNEIRTRCPSFVNFWDNVSEYILKKNGEIIFGEDKELHHNALEKMAQRGKEIDALRDPLYKKFEELQLKSKEVCSRYEDVQVRKERKKFFTEQEEVESQVKDIFNKMDNVDPFIERDPHFAKVITENSLDIVILGQSHIPYIIQHCFPDNNYSLCYVPSEDLINALKNKEKV